MRKFNFSAGPSMLYEEVLRRVQDGLVDYNGTGMSVMEMSHRSKPYEAINADAEALLRELMDIPSDYDVIFVQGGASMQFEAIPLNLSRDGAYPKGDYVITGNFSEKAYKEAVKYGDMVAAASSKDKNFTYIPALSADSFRKDADYVHICYNNTIFGSRFASVPDTGGIPLVADLSSCILGQAVDVRDFSVIYAGAQKNIGPAGVTVVIVKKELANRAHPLCPTMMKWSTQIKEKSLYNTPPAFSTYVATETFKYVKELGGVAAVQKANEKKAGMLYDYIDGTDFYNNPVEKPYRSIMNVTFTSPSKELDEQFAAEAAKVGLVSLKGHRLVGGMRASIYNAMPPAGIEALIAFMKDFERKNG
ncbi:MAG: 3-phosphoserine/phosphohydroxythreonine transaminase [Clostridiales bacterium]|jgi:phosphoserine aminotransferase|nr:3-phosphoserine/phosphohydroxythreonine transaminase [Clostridiales bacterium]